MESIFKAVPVYDNVCGECVIGGEITLKAKTGAYSVTRAEGRFTDITGNKVYEITVPFRADGLTNGKAQAIASWVMENGELYSRSYFAKAEDGVLKLSYHIPGSVNALDIEYRLWSHGGGEAVFGMPQIVCKGDYKPRPAKLAAAWVNTHYDGRTLDDNLNEILHIADIAGKSDKPDLLAFSETIYGRNVDNMSMAEKALKLDSEAVRSICGKAAQYRMYIVIGLMIEENGLYKNVALVIGRKGEIIHVYNKTHLTMGEIECGIVPGTEIPVYDLDFGRVGVLICWDHYFSEPARILHLKGAEVIIIPSAGDAPQNRVRAVDSGAYVVVSGMHKPDSTVIFDPKGNTAATVTDLRKSYACAEVDLNRRHFEYWLSVGACFGEGRNVYLNERRNELYGELCLLPARN